MLVNQAIMGGNTLGDALTTLWCLSCPSWCWQWWKIWVSLLTWFEVANLLIDQLIHHFTVMRSFHTLWWMLHSLDKTNSSPWLTAGSSYQLAWSSMHHWYINYKMEFSRWSIITRRHCLDKQWMERIHNFHTNQLIWNFSLAQTDVKTVSDYVQQRPTQAFHYGLTFLVLSGSELAPSVLIADFPGWGWGRE